MKIKKILPAVLIILSGCSSADSEMRQNVIASVRNGQLDAAAETLFSEKYMNRASDTFVREAERGSVQYLKGNYRRALLHFDKAAAVAKQMFTVSVSKTAGAQIFGDSMTDYPGERYEQSLIRFYQSLCHYLLYQQGFYEAVGNTPKKMLTPEERRQHLTSSRAVLVDWDAFLKDLSRSNAGKAVFTQDMVAKVWGGVVHRAVGSSNDNQIADMLFGQIPSYLTRNYAMYPAFNANWMPYVREYADLPEKSAATLKESYLKSTEYTRGLRDLAKRAGEGGQNTTIVLKTGLVGERFASEPKFKLDPTILAAAAAVSRADMKTMLALFLANGLITVPIPNLECPRVDAEYGFLIKDEKGKVFTRGKMALIDPVSEIACQEYLERYPALVEKKLARMGAKYALAVVGAAAAQRAAREMGKQHGDGWGEFFAAIGGAGVLAAEHAAIQASEAPDLRYWSLLPDAVWMQTLSLPQGRYTIEILNGDITVYTDAFTVAPDRGTVVDINIPTE